MKLPNASSAYVDIKKLRNYSLDTTHHRGKHKARLFSSILGFSPADAEELKAILLAAAQQYDATPEPPTEYGLATSLTSPLPTCKKALPFVVVGLFDLPKTSHA